MTGMLRWFGVLAVNDTDNAIQPTAFGLGQPYPNPFNDRTWVRFALDAPAPARVEVYDLSGRLVVNLHEGMLTAGIHSVMWEAGAMPSGMYLLRLESAGRRDVGRVVVGR
jgi:hypothetical protein